MIDGEINIQTDIPIWGGLMAQTDNLLRWRIFGGRLFKTVRVVLPSCRVTGKYEDWNGDGIIDDSDVYPNVYEHTNDNGNPKMTFGATIAAEWKGFDVNLLFQGGGGFNVIYFEQLQYPLCFGGNGLAHFYDRYRQERKWELDSRKMAYDP